jgi:ABC-type multidrug transport system fused ATPase/permease subunit
MNISDNKSSSSDNNQTVVSGKMMSDENLEDSRVGLDSYKVFLNYLGGWKFIVLTQVAMIGFTSFKILSDYQVGNWAASPDQSKRFGYYSALTFGYATINSLFTFMRVAVLVFTGWKASKLIHNHMLNKVLNAPINLYFDITPIGRILNRFSKDLSILETQFFWPLGGFLVCLY